MFTRSYSDRSNDRNRGANSMPERDYDQLKKQCDTEMHKLRVLRRQYEEIVQRNDQTRNELEYYCSQNQGLSSFGNRSELDIPEHDTASGDSLNDYSMPYDSTLEDYKTLKKRYEDLNTTHSAAVVKMDKMKDEINQLKEQSNNFFKAQDIVIREMFVLKRQRTTAVQKWNLTLRDNKYLKEAIQIVQQEHERAVKGMKAAFAYGIRIRAKLNELNKVHDAVMSERNIVNNELEKLSDDLSMANYKNKILENQIQSCTEENKTLQLHVALLIRGVSSAFHDCDKAHKECNDYQERFGEVLTKIGSQREFKSHLYYDLSREIENKKHSQEHVAPLDLFNSCQKERMDNLDQANQEIERLRKLADKYHYELDKSLEEAEVFKRLRDWSFSERDKIVLERESIRALCDSLRKQRDDAVSKLARVIRDCDDIMKQKSDTAKNHNDFKEKMGFQLEKEVCLLKLQATGCYSQDSAIDTDLQDYDTEILNIDLGVLGINEDLGIDLHGGRDGPLYPNDNAIYISSVNKGCVAARKLRVNDCILRVNSLDCTSISKQLVLETLRSLSSATLVVSRRKPASPSRSLFTTQLEVNNYNHGISLETGVYISKITPGSMAAKDGNLDVGDGVISINNTTLDNVKLSKEAILSLNGLGYVLTITTLKSTYCDGNPLPVNNSIFEQDQKNAMAELDSVIDAFKPHPAPPTTTKYLTTGDCILECNRTYLREGTAEEAAFELVKPAEKVTVLAQYLIDKYNEIKDKPGDSFYIRALFDRTIELSEAGSNSSQLPFRKDDVLYVDNTLHNGVSSNWRAWLVDHNGYKQQVGIIPSKYRVEEKLVIRCSGEKLEGDALHATIRSFFTRKNHQHSSSKELACFSNINLGWHSSDSGNLHDDATVMPSYQEIIRLNSKPSILTTDLIKFESTEQVKLDNESRPSHDKMSTKAAKDMYEHALKLGPEYRHFISAAIPYMCTQIKAADD